MTPSAANTARAVHENRTHRPDSTTPRSSTPSPLPAAVKHFGEVERAVAELGTLPGQAVMYLTPEDAADLRKWAVALRTSLKAWTARLDAEAPKGSEWEN